MIDAFIEQSGIHSSRRAVLETFFVKMPEHLRTFVGAEGSSGRLRCAPHGAGHRLLDGRYEITGGVPDNAVVVSQLRSSLRVGRVAKISEEPSR